MQASFENTVPSREGAEKSSLARLPLESRGRFPALRLVLIYAFFGALWILLSDRLLSNLVPDIQLAERLQTYKGWFFVAVTSVLLWLLTQRFLSQVRAAEEALGYSNRQLRAISNCNQVLLRATDEQSLLEEICRIVCEEAGYRMAWVAYAEHDEAKSVRPVAWPGAEEGYLANLGITWADTERGRSPTGTAIRSGKSCCIQDFATDPRLAPWRESALQHGFRSGIALPLKDEHGNAFGSLSIYSAQPNAFTPKEIRLLDELAGDLAFGIVTLRSQAARQQAEQKVDLLGFALDKVREAAFLLDDMGRFHYVNEEGCRVLGYSRAELLGLGIADIDPEFPAERWSDHWRDLKAQRSLNFESLHRTLAGRIFPVEISANYFEYGGRAYNLALVRDITERKRVEEALRRSEAYLAEAQALTHTGSWALNLASGKYDYVSEEDFRIFGFDPQEALPTREAVFRRIHPEDRNGWKEKFERSLREKVDSFDDYRIVLPDGTIKYIHSIRHPVLNSAGDVVKLVGTSIDITERKRAEEALQSSEAERRRTEQALQETRAELERVSRVTTMGALTASIAHEVNQPLAGVVTSANAGLNWLAANPPNLSKAREALERVRRDGTRAGEVIARIRGLLKRTAPAKTLVNVNQVVNDMLALTAGELRGDNIETALALDLSLPAVFGDTIQLQQVLLNLITNAIEAMADVAKGQRTLRIQSTLGELEGKPAVVVAVSDTGIGLGSGDIALLFEAFRTTKPHGMGMGLWISRSIIEEYGGRLTAQPNAGRGATFVLTIPAEPELAK